MKLISLEVKVDGQTRRVVNFQDGLNLVMNRQKIGRSGNSVGKSTLSRVVDFLFIGSIDPIYIDEEFKKPNKDIEDLFVNQNVTAELSFIGSDKIAHQIKRNLSIINDNNQFWLDGKPIKEGIYEREIQNLCFGINTRRSSIRAIIPKFIRNDSHKMLNTTKFLDKHSGKKEYSELFLYLFGFKNSQLLTEKRDANNLVKRRSRSSQSINAMVREQKPKMEVKKYSLEAKELESDLLKFDYSPEYDNPVERLTKLQHKENLYTDSLMSIERKLSNIDKTIRVLTDGQEIYLEKEVKTIYEYAGVKLDGSIRELHEVFSFHENLVNKKKRFLAINIPDLYQEKEEFEAELSAVRRDKLKVFSDMRSTESINNITVKLKKLGELKIELGKLEGLLEQQGKATKDLEIANNLLSQVLIEIANAIQSIYSFETLLNKYFKLLTSQIHNEEYAFNLNYDEKTGNCDIQIINTVTNPEGGKKKAEVIAFDLAYINAVDESGVNRPKFVFHDSIEDIDSKQIEIIFHEANKVPGQQIISMLSDKLTNEIHQKYDSNIILLLDEKNRFFGI